MWRSAVFGWEERKKSTGHCPPWREGVISGREKSEKIEAEWKKETRLKNIAFAKDLWVLHLLSEVIMYLPTDTYWIPTMLSGTVPALGEKARVVRDNNKSPFPQEVCILVGNIDSKQITE